MAENLPGRHRAPGRFNPLVELKLIAKESAQPAVKGAAIVAASGGLVATAFASPANAAEGSGNVVAAQGAVSAPSVAGPASGAVQVGTALSTIGFAAPAKAKAPAKAPAVIQDLVVEQQRAESTAKAKAAADQAAAQQAAAQRTATAARASRSDTRTAIASTTSQAAATTTAPSQSASGLVAIAQQAFGVPYRYGGTSMSGFDCSGFTSWVYRQAGISIPRTASAQQSAATPVSSPRPGDLVFFGYPAYHVGIYASPGRLIDAQRTGTVVGNHSIWTTPSGYGRF